MPNVTNTQPVSPGGGLARRFERFLLSRARSVWSGCVALRTQGHSWLICVPDDATPNATPAAAIEADDLVLRGVVAGHINPRDAVRWGDVRIIGDTAARAALLAALLA